MEYYLQGLMVGLAYVAPIGMQNLFVINSAISQGKKRAYLTAAIVVFFDISLSLACYFGIGAIMQALSWLEKIILCVGSLIVIWIGISLIRSKAKLSGGADVNIPILKLITTAFVVTWINPQALIDGTMLLGACRADLGTGGELPFVLGFTSASPIWFFGLSTVLSLFGGKLTDKLLRIINIVCGAIMIFYGLKLFYSFIWPILFE